MSVTLQDLREIAIYRCKPDQFNFSDDEIDGQQRLLDRAYACAMDADRAAAKGNVALAMECRKSAFWNVYRVARLHFFRFGDEQRLWLCHLAAKLALAADYPAQAQECCEVGLLDADDDVVCADDLRYMREQALELMRLKEEEVNG